MEILVILFLLGLIGFLLFLLYKFIRWVSRKKARIYIVSSILGILIIFKTIDHFFFTKMEFIQSKVYPNLYLIKNQIENRDSLNVIIKNRVIEMINKKSTISKKMYPKNSYTAPYATFAFYTYTKNSRLSIFQDYGTAYFIDNEEDPGGFSVEDLLMYRSYLLATYNIRNLKKDSASYYGVLEYYKDDYLVKTDTLVTKIQKSEIFKADETK